MANGATERLENILRNIAVEFPSIEVLKASVRRERGSYVLAATVDREHGVDTDLCEQLARYIERRVDSLSPPVGAYAIEVASAGLDRPLLIPAHFARFRGQPARIITSFKVANRVEFAGPIESADDVKVTIADRYAGRVEIPYGAIKRAHLVYEPAADLKRARHPKEVRGR